jgi:hypothetical protein
MLLDNLKHEKLESNILLWKNVISKENCNTIIKLIEENSDWQNAKVGNKENTKEDTSYRSNKVDYLTSRFGINSNVYWCHNTIGYGIKKVVEETVKEYNYNKNDLNYFVSQDEGFQVLKYEKGQFYKTHLDTSKENGRVLSVLLYLNEDYEGGETYFPRQDIKIKGEQGDVLLFPSNYCYPHSAEEILNGIKYSVVTWFK